MPLDYLTLNIEYDLNTNKFKVSGDINEKGRKELVEAFLSSQVGAGIDKNKPNELDKYHIQLKWYPNQDDIQITTNTGNKGLRDGILMYYLSQN